MGGMAANLRGAVDLSGLVRRANAPAGADAGAADDGIVFRTDDAGFADVAERSKRVPVLIEFADERAGSTGVADVVRSYGGRIVLATVDLLGAQQLIQAFQVQQLPFLAALIGGRPVPLFAGLVPEQELRDVIDQVLELAVQQGVTGTAVAGGDVEEPGEPEPEPLPPLHQEAYDAIEAGDLSRAIRAYETAIAQNPRDDLAKAGLSQVRLLDRLAAADAGAVRAAAAAAPQDVAAQLAVADLDLAGGHVDDAFGRLLDLIATVFGADREPIRARLLEYFDIVGVDEPSVAAARRRLASLLY
jgi:putative thioredoxin